MKLVPTSIGEDLKEDGIIESFRQRKRSRIDFYEMENRKYKYKSQHEVGMNKSLGSEALGLNQEVNTMHLCDNVKRIRSLFRSGIPGHYRVSMRCFGFQEELWMNVI